jgi:hypothetical protein
MGLRQEVRQRWLSERWKDLVHWLNEPSTLLNIGANHTPRAGSKGWGELYAERCGAIRQAEEARTAEEARKEHEFWLATQPPPPKPKKKTKKQKIAQLKQHCRRELEAYRSLGLPDDELEIISARLKDELAAQVERLFDG